MCKLLISIPKERVQYRAYIPYAYGRSGVRKQNLSGITMSLTCNGIEVKIYPLGGNYFQFSTYGQTKCRNVFFFFF